MSPLSPAPDKTRMTTLQHDLQKQFDRRATKLPQHDALLREIENRLWSRLELIRLNPGVIVDVGCGSGQSRARFLQRFGHARWIGVDLSHRMLQEAHVKPTLGQRILAHLGKDLGPEALVVCADAACLPFADQSVDLIFSNLMLHWHNAPHLVIAEWARVLRPGGLVLFSSYGPDTFRRLRQACVSTLPHARPTPFVDMHDLGDMMMSSGLEAPVMECEPLSLQFGTVKAMLTEARALGANPRADRARFLPGGAQARALYQALTLAYQQEGSAQLDFEIVIGHGWRQANNATAVQKVQVPVGWRI